MQVQPRDLILRRQHGTQLQLCVPQVSWNGASWSRVASPNPGGPSNNNFLFGVAATSSANAWGVGYYSNGTSSLTLALHCC